jgi:glycosyltransferase involved in cell wall biosynthesis
MRILYLTHTVTWSGGGIFFTAYHQGRHLAARGHDVTLVSISPTARWGFKEHLASGVRIVESPDLLSGKARTGWDMWDALWRTGYLSVNDFDLVHGYESRPIVSLPALFAKRVRRLPLVFTWADWFGRGGKGEERGRLLSKVMAPIETFFEERFYPLADRCVIMGEPLVERAVSLGVSRDRILNLLHGCDPDGIQPMALSDARSRLPGLPQNGVVLGYLGALRPINAKLLFETFRIIRMRVSGPCKLVLIGNNKLPEWRDYVPLDCTDSVIETGWLSYGDISVHLAACDLLLLPWKKTIATDNVWPSKLNDALAAGRPVVATEMRVLKSVFQQYRVGILTHDEPFEFAEGCLRLLDDMPLRVEMGLNARNLAEGALSWRHIVDQLEAFYFDLLRDRA